MSAPPSNKAASGKDEPVRPDPTAIQTPSGPSGSTSTVRADGKTETSRRKRNHRGGAKKKRNRRPSFAASSDQGDGSGMPETSQSSRAANAQSAARNSFYRQQGRNLSNTSIESETLLDHR